MLTKREVEDLLAAVEAAGDDADAVRAALVAAGAPAAGLPDGLDGLFAVAAEMNETRQVPLRVRASAWLADDPDPLTQAELRAVLDAGDDDELADRFRARLTFGTAGIRGALGAGPSRMNVTNVRAAVAGVARWVGGAGPVVLGRDARHRSDDFLDEAARVLSGAGIDALVLPGEVPTPVLAFAVRHLGAAAGLMVTASHNPPSDNGVKVYGADGAQIVPPTDGEIASHIDAIVDDVSSLPLSDDRVRHLDGAVLDAYLAGAAATVPDGWPRSVRVVHTAMHGVGWEPMRRLFELAGFPKPVAVWEQAHPDGAFPTVPFPNPEEPGALDRALAVARSAGADVLLANDPDADRLGVAVKGPDGWRALTGDEIGVLLADHVLQTTTGDDRLVACSLVSSSMLGRMADDHGVAFATTLTGFKWIVRAADAHPGTRLVFGYEEALGYLVAPDLVRDKDGLTAALAFTCIVAKRKAEGSTVLQRLDELAARYGRHRTRQVSVRADIEAIAAAVDRLVSSPPAAVGSLTVTSTERPADDILVLHLDGGARVIVRPSGTEPKLKAYLQVISEDDTLDQLEADVRNVLGL
jgi:phosphomannomutase